MLVENTSGITLSCMLTNRADYTLIYTQSQAMWWCIDYCLLFWQKSLKAITHGRESIFFQEIHTWNYNPLPVQSKAEMNDGHRELPCAITAGHCSLNMFTLRKDSSKSLLSPSRTLHSQSCWSREFPVKQTLLSIAGYPPLEFMLQSL